MESHCMLDGKGPEFLMDDRRPAVHGMEQDGTCPFGDGANEALGNPILPMGANGTVGLSLTFLGTRVFEGLCRVYSIIRTDGFNIDIETSRPSFKVFLGSQELGGCFSGMKCSVY
jgi:hypothetical protein